MRGVGLSRQKTAYLRDLSEKTKAGLLEFERMSEMSEDEVIAHLTQVKGVGVWTAHMFLMFTLRHVPIFCPSAITASRPPSRSTTKNVSGPSLR
jgi:DNA-3-methyladenine glycosylase II